MIRDRPYETIVPGFDFQVAALVQRIALACTGKSLAPAFEVIQTEAFHIKLTHPLIGNLLKPVVFTHADGSAAAAETGFAHSSEIRRSIRIFALTAISFGTDEVLL